MKKFIRLLLASVIIFSLTACQDQEPSLKNLEQQSQAEDPKEENKTVEEEKIQPGEKLSEKISVDEAKKIAFEVYEQYRNRQINNDSSYTPPELESIDQLFLAEEVVNIDLDMGYGSHFYELRERYPGSYVAFVASNGQEADDTRLCLYVNRHSQEVFQDEGYLGTYRLPQDDLVIYIPYAFDGMNDDAFMMQVLRDNKMIENRQDAMAEWFMQDYDYASEPDYEMPAEDVIRMPVVNTSNGARIGIYDINVTDRSVHEYPTGILLYQDPLTQYPEKNITENNAVEETVNILQYLYEIEQTEDGNYEYEVTKEDMTQSLGFKGYRVKITDVDSKQNPSLVEKTYYINDKGTKIAIVMDDGFYSLIYGTLME